jgi:hypothetical protein
MNPLVTGLIAMERMAHLQEEADRWRQAHPSRGAPARHRAGFAGFLRSRP